MQLTPRYGSDPIITLDGSPRAIAEPTIRQRRRLVDVLGAFTDEQWAHPSRCEGWSNRDVMIHLDTTNTFWSFATSAGLKGEPTQFLATFDPVASPAELVRGAGDRSPAEVLERFASSTEAFAQLLESLDDDGWIATAESPVGHVTVSALAHHALWDSWIHERDVMLPLGLAPAEEADEVLASLRYAAALGPAYALSRDASTRGTLGIEVTDPDAAFSLVIDGRVDVRTNTDGTTPDLVLTGEAVDLTEALSIRLPLATDVPPNAAWMVDGLYTTFDTVRT